MIKELIVISGKGGTGKTSVTASFACLAKNKIIADCDVDAADLHLVLENTLIEKTEFEGGKKAEINTDMCTKCGQCLLYCRFNAIGDYYIVDPLSCEGCGVCAYFCPCEAITMENHVSGHWFLSDTDHGPLIHAKLGIAEGNSGKLVTLIKKKAREMAQDKGFNLVLVDGSPGTGCPVIATISGSYLVLAVVEPTVSGIHDLQRVQELVRHFNVTSTVCINKADINMEITAEIEQFCNSSGITVLGKIPFDRDVTRAQLAGKSVVEFSQGPAATEIRAVWEKLSNLIQG